jgi:hypothetical protein
MAETYTAVFKDFRAGTPTIPFRMDGLFTVIVYRDPESPRSWRAKVQGSGAPLRVSARREQTAKLHAESFFAERLTPWSHTP